MLALLGIGVLLRTSTTASRGLGAPVHLTAQRYERSGGREKDGGRVGNGMKGEEVKSRAETRFTHPTDPA